MLGGVNMRKSQIYIKNRKNTLKNRKKWGCVVTQLAGSFPPRRWGGVCVKISLYVMGVGGFKYIVQNPMSREHWIMIGPIIAC